MTGAFDRRPRAGWMLWWGLVSSLGASAGCVVVPQTCFGNEYSTATVVVVVPEAPAEFDLEFELEERDGDAFPPFALYCTLLADENYECFFSRLEGYDFEVEPYPMPIFRTSTGALEFEFDVLTTGPFSRLAGGRVALLQDDTVLTSVKGRTSKYEVTPEGECSKHSYADMVVVVMR